MPRNDERSVAEVLQDILGNLQDIVRSEVRLAKVEFKTETSHAAKAAKPLIAGAILSFYAGGLFLLALVHGLSRVLAPWMAALSVGILVSLFAAISIGAGRARLRYGDATAKRTIETLKEDAEWLNDQTR